MFWSIGLTQIQITLRLTRHSFPRALLAMEKQSFKCIGSISLPLRFLLLLLNFLCGEGLPIDLGRRLLIAWTANTCLPAWSHGWQVSELWQCCIQTAELHVESCCVRELEESDISHADFLASGPHQWRSHAFGSNCRIPEPGRFRDQKTSLWETQISHGFAWNVQYNCSSIGRIRRSWWHFSKETSRFADLERLGLDIFDFTEGLLWGYCFKSFTDARDFYVDLWICMSCFLTFVCEHASSSSCTRKNQMQSQLSWMTI